MEMPTPNALFSDMLHQRGSMVEDGLLELLREAGELDVLHARHTFPMFQKIARRVAGNEKSLASEYGERVGDKGVGFGIGRDFLNTGIIKAGEGDFARHHG